MKKFLFVLVLILIALPVLADNNTITAKSTVTETNKQETIGIDVVPVIRLDNSNPKVIQSNEVYAAPIIAPATEESTLKLDLGNLKNIKKAPILPDDNSKVSVLNYMRYFHSSYQKVFTNLLGILDKSDFSIASYDSSSGRFFCNYQGKKPVYITVTEANISSVVVKINPADGVYDIPAGAVKSIFDELNNSLQEK